MANTFEYIAFYVFRSRAWRSHCKKSDFWSKEFIVWWMWRYCWLHSVNMWGVEFRTLPSSCWISIYRAMSWQGHCYHYSDGSAPVWIYSLSVFIRDVQERVWMLSNALGSQENDQEEDGEWVLMRAGGQSLSGRGWCFCVMVNVKLDTSWGHLGRGNQIAL